MVAVPAVVGTYSQHLFCFVVVWISLKLKLVYIPSRNNGPKGNMSKLGSFSPVYFYWVRLAFILFILPRLYGCDRQKCQ